MYQNPNTMVSDLESGAIDGAWGIPEAQYKALTSRAGIHTIAYNFFNWDYIDLNCSSSPDSTGNPVLRDVRFRDALNYAIDRNKLCQLAYEGLAAPATTIMPPDTWSNPDYHWQPPADQAYTFDLAKASQLLTAAGYPLKNGVRLNKQGKAITLRLATTTDFPQGQVEAKLIAGWLQQLGPQGQPLDHRHRRSSCSHLQLQGHDLRPRLRPLPERLGRLRRPRRDADLVHHGADRRNQRAGLVERRLRQAERAAIGRARPHDAPQRHLADAADLLPAVAPDRARVSAVPGGLQHGALDRWTPMFNGRGPAWMTTATVDSYLNLKPVTTSSSSGGKGVTIAIVVVVVVVVAGAAIWLVRRRRTRLEEA